MKQRKLIHHAPSLSYASITNCGNSNHCLMKTEQHCANSMTTGHDFVAQCQFRTAMFEEFMWLEQGQQDLLGIGYDFPLFIALFNTHYDWYLGGINWAQNPEGHLVKTAAPILGKYAMQLTQWGDSIPEGEIRINFALNAAASCINGGYFTETDFFSGVYTLGWFDENWSVEAYKSVSLDIDRDYLLSASTSVSGIDVPSDCGNLGFLF